MRYPLAGVIGSLAYLAVIVVVPIGAHALLQRVDGDALPFYVPIWSVIFLSVITPFSVIAIRTQVRLIRVRLIDLFAAAFRLHPYGGAGSDSLVTFEFVRGKYFVDLPGKPDQRDIDRVPRFPMLLHSDWMLLFCAVPYMVFSGFGIFLLLAPEAFLHLDQPIWSWLRPSVLAVGGATGATLSDPATADAYHRNVLTVAAFAFAGSYFFTLRLFLRAVVVFDLSTVTFLRAFAHMVLSVILTVVIYRTFPSDEYLQGAASTFTGWLQGTTPIPAPQPFDPTDGVGSAWLIVAFALGFIPDSALYYVLQKSGISFKDRCTGLDWHAKLVPMTLIDGIDHFIAFRLEEANIFDVQNLACFNPIMLHIESPYGIYQTIDWVAQAQLCCVVGPERFLALKTLNIRTIFDLQRAVLGPRGDPNADLGGSFGTTFVPDPNLLDAIADLLLLDVKRDQKLRGDIGRTGPIPLQQAVTAESPFTLGTRRETVVHLVNVMLDDLHVHRLRQLWRHIELSLKPGP